MHPCRLLATGLALALIMPAVQAQSMPAAKGFNPKISLILQGSYADYAVDEEPEVPGVVLGPETELRPAGFSIGESELVLESNVDDQFHAWATVALENEDGETVVAVEEAYLNTLALPAGLAVKMGRFLSELGYLNHVHSHAWEFVDMPLVYRALLANQYKDDGVQLRWVAPTDLFFELGVEGLRGAGFPGGGEARDGLNGSVVFAHLGGDAGTGGAWRVGLSHLQADAEGRVSGEEIPVAFTGDSGVSILDLVYKWAPDGNPVSTNVVVHAEFFRREEDGTVVSEPDGAADSSAYEGTQSGFYAEAIWQFMPRWRIGARYDSLEADSDVANPAAGTALETLADEDRATRTSVMADFSNSEFSRLRLQYNADESRPGGERDDQFFVQYIMSIGAHPAHQF